MTQMQILGAPGASKQRRLLARFATGRLFCSSDANDEAEAQTIVRTNGSDAARVPAMQTGGQGAQAPAAGAARGRQIRIRLSALRLHLRHHRRDPSTRRPYLASSLSRLSHRLNRGRFDFVDDALFARLMKRIGVNA